MLFLLLFTGQNAIVTGEVTLDDLKLTVGALNEKMNLLEAEVNDLKSEVKVWFANRRHGLYQKILYCQDSEFVRFENEPFEVIAIKKSGN